MKKLLPLLLAAPLFTGCVGTYTRTVNVTKDANGTITRTVTTAKDNGKLTKTVTATTIITTTITVTKDTNGKITGTNMTESVTQPSQDVSAGQ